MEYEELTILLSGDYPAYARYWPANPVRGAVLYHHGIQSHCGWYEASAAHLAGAGYAVLQFDRRGSGRNEQARGHADSADELISDTLAARDELLRRSGRSDYHAIGVSWGGKMVAQAYIAAPAGVRSMTLVTPGLFPLVGVSKSEMAKIGFAMLYEPHQLFNIPLDGAELFTAAPSWQAFINEDPLTLRQCTAGFYLASRRMDKPISGLAKCASVPVHLFLAGDERIVDNAKTEAFVNGLGWVGSRITSYETARHSLEFENDRTLYFRAMQTFLDDMEAGRT